ncbi:Dual specificity protein phosphatase cdc14a [Entomortierella beljakovae]|nr:Dual specificity protein phosphatase cdc14a [Entomortierella beljakovae]
MSGQTNDVLPWFQQLPQYKQHGQDSLVKQPRDKPEQSPQSKSKSRILDDIDREASNVCEFIEDQLYFMWTSINPISTRRTTYLVIDDYLQYTAFFSDFGPFDIADVFRFCCLLKERVETAKTQGKVLCLHTRPEDTKRANAAFALCCYMMLLHNKTPEEAFAPIKYVHPPITPYRDAGSGESTYTLSILDCLRGLSKGLELGLIRLDQFDVLEYEHYERVSNGDFNWITPFFIAFAGPRDKLTLSELQGFKSAGPGIRSGSKRINSNSKSKSCSASSKSKSPLLSKTTTTSRATSSQSSADGAEDSDSRSSRSESVTTTSASSTSWWGCSSGTPSSLDSNSGSESISSSESNTTPPPISKATISESSDTLPLGSTKSNALNLTTGMNSCGSDYNTGSESDVKEARTKRRKKKHRTRLTKSFQSVLDYFETHQVKCVIRLNAKAYDEDHFLSRGIDHFDLIYPDGTCPPWSIVEQFLEICEHLILDTKIESNGKHHFGVNKGNVVAIHCMAGLGRTGTLIAVFLMRHFNMTARETIAFLRLMRPGSVVGPQQNWLAQNEHRILNHSWRDVRYPGAEKVEHDDGGSDGSLQRMKIRSGNINEDPKSELEEEEEDHRMVEGVESTVSQKGEKSDLMTGPIIKMPIPPSAKDYHGIFSKAGPELFDSTSSETEFDSESDNEIEVSGLLEESHMGSSRSWAPSALRHGMTIEVDEDELRDVDFMASVTTTTTAGESSSGLDTGEEEEDDTTRQTRHPYGLYSSSASIVGPSPLYVSNSVQSLFASQDSMNDNLHHGDVKIKEILDSQVEMDRLQSQSLGMQHVGNKEFIIPTQPRKQHQQHQHQQQQQQTHRMEESSPVPTNKPHRSMSVLSSTFQRDEGLLKLGKKNNMVRHTEINGLGAKRPVIGDDDKMAMMTEIVDGHESQPFTKIKRTSHNVVDKVPDSPPSLNDDEVSSQESLAMTSSQEDVMEFSPVRWSQHDTIHNVGQSRERKSSRGVAGL